MGLAERRALEMFKTEKYPPLAREIHDLVGFEVPIEVDWTSLAVENQSHLYESCWPVVYFETTLASFREVCRDELGREAVKEGLKKIVFKNSGQHSGVAGITFVDGVLIIDHKPTTNVDGPSIPSRVKHLVSLLERNL